jgi:predicted Zn finger-like uncharacterized protein
VNVTCADCASIFRVDPAKIPIVGVRARCSVCGAVFRVAPTHAGSADASAPPAVAAAAIGWGPSAATPRVAEPRPGSDDVADTAWRDDRELPGTVPAPGSAADPVTLAAPPEVSVAALPPIVVPPPPGEPPLADAPVVQTPAGALPIVQPPEVPQPATASAPVPTAGPGAPALQLAVAPTAISTRPPEPSSSTATPAAAADAPAERPHERPAPATPEPNVPPSAGDERSLATPRHAPRIAGRPDEVTDRRAERSATPAPAEAANVPTAPRRFNPYLSNDPSQRARRLARALVSDLVVYHPQKREEGLRAGTLKALFREEIRKSWEEYVGQVGAPTAESTTHFQDALNDILAGGRKIF